MVQSFPYRDFFDMISEMAVYYSPANSKAFSCMFQSCFDMIPQNDDVKNILYEAVQQNPLNKEALKNGTELLMWSYNINSYVHRNLYNTRYIDFEKFQDRYNPTKTSIVNWARPTWKNIHYFSANYDGSKDYALSYKSFVSCLQFLLPCGKCRDHLKQNLADHHIDDFFDSRTDLFLWSYILHQLVNSQLNKKGISLTEARHLYNVEK